MSAGKPRQLPRSPSEAWLALRMAAWAVVLPVLKHTVALPKLARLMWCDGGGSAAPGDIDRVVRLSALAARVRPRPSGDSENCLERSLIAYRYLSAINADPRLVVAVRTENRRETGHAWVTVQGTPVAGEDLSMFTPILELGPHGAPVAAV